MTPGGGAEPSDPTGFPDLNDVLEELVAGARSALGENLCGVYLQGSFAVGDADIHSDVDFVVVTNDEVGDDQLVALQTLHGHLYTLDTPWAQHLEGSYIPRQSLHRLDPARPQYLYLDNGSTELEWDNHCNTDLVRWSLREHGVTLAGPDPRTLIDPVSADQLRRDVLVTMEEWASWARSTPMSGWKQPYVVVTGCRMLNTLHTGIGASKRDAGEWALVTLPDEWTDLVKRALADRPDPWLRVHREADPQAVAATVAFVDYVTRQGAREAACTTGVEHP